MSEVISSFRSLRAGSIAPIAQLVSTLDLVTSSEQVEGSILTAGKKVESEKSECNNSGYKLTGLTWWP